MGYLENVINMAHTTLNFSSVFQQSKLSSNNEGSVCVRVRNLRSYHVFIKHRSVMTTSSRALPKNSQISKLLIIKK